MPQQLPALVEMSHPQSQEGGRDSSHLAPPPALPGAEGCQRTARADLPETKDGTSAR